ncbi:hypothetical protein MES5069_450065 [Mesorhizobium escarrei]|uniref:Uncharacterized protein n=1 Tax=Mesorhizobium escarrei TaxID=666018 RepID=A0ABN8K6T1_9HYPH|nr:hypothetical protein MES5069_450065 [Mesorhizobium escarrei]
MFWRPDDGMQGGGRMVAMTPNKVRETAAHARRLGFAGALRFIERRVAMFNEGFSPSAQALKWARDIIASEMMAPREDCLHSR